MAKFGNTQALRSGGPLKTTSTQTRTGNSALALEKDAKTALFTLAVVNMVNEKAFYESAQERDSRFVNLIRQVTSEDPQWVARFVPFLRDTMQMRSASIVVAAEYVKAGGPQGRAVVASAISRADEPAEMLGYWTSKYGKSIPQAIKRGVADASRRVFNEYAMMKYDGNSRGWRVGDVLQIAHVRPQDAVQSDLFQYALDRRYKGADAVPAESLRMVRASRELADVLNDKQARERFLADPNAAKRLKAAGMTWENLAGTGKMDARAWEAVIPSMGYMALLRNLRNFDEAGVSDEVAAGVALKLVNADEVARSRQFPYRFLSAYKSVRSDRWTSALSKALDLSVQNIPVLDGHTVTYIDVSGSMTSRASEKSEIHLWEIGALFGAAFAKQNGGHVWAWADSAKRLDIRKGDSVLRSIDKVGRAMGSIGYGTNLAAALRQADTENRREGLHERRSVVFTDMQVNPLPTVGNRDGWGWRYGELTLHDELIKADYFYAFDLAGYNAVPFTADGNRFMLAGFTDKVFTMMPLLERGKADWPF